MRLSILATLIWQLVLSVNERRWNLTLARRWSISVDVGIEPSPIDRLGDESRSETLEKTPVASLPFVHQ